MNACILCVGKLKEKWQTEGCNEYLKRLSRYGKYEIVQIDDQREPENASPALIRQIIDKEGKVLLSKIKPTDRVVALCVKAQAPDSVKLSELMQIVKEKYGNWYMKECAFTFTQQVKQQLQKRLFEDMEVPDVGGVEIDHVSYLDGCKIFFKNGGWVIVRFSGTEPLLRVFCEMPTKSEAVAVCDSIRKFYGI